ncbi:unnamed protein product [Amoebophrya sp. A25]|nr:unnamed protein product [Amoebophrya sp. A25]|eukprot:GSA25T00015213001.1
MHYLIKGFWISPKLQVKSFVELLKIKIHFTNFVDYRRGGTSLAAEID